MTEAVSIITTTIALVSVLAPVVIARRSSNRPPTSRGRMVWWLPLSVVLVAGGILLSLIIHGAVDSRLHIFLSSLSSQPPV
jgi:hypothetical protein